MNPVFEPIASGFVWTDGRETLRVEAWGPDAVRVRATVDASFPDAPGALLSNTPPVPPALTWETDGNGTCGGMETGGLRVRVSPQGALSFFHRGRLLTAEEYGGRVRRQRIYRPLGGGFAHTQVRFQAFEDERIFGLGQHPNGRLDQKGLVLDLHQINNEVNIPFLFSSRGYGLLWNNPALGRVELTPERTRWVAEACTHVDYVVFAGEAPADILRAYARCTGLPPPFPQWAEGFWQSRLRYRTQQEVLSVARRHVRELGLPMSMIVIDYFHWTAQGNWDFDPADWPDPAGMVRELEEMGIKTMVSVWPRIEDRSRHAAPMRDGGMLLELSAADPAREAHPRSKDSETGAYYDPSHPEARRYIQQGLSGYLGQGIQHFWLDGCEPDLCPWDFPRLRYHAGPASACANLYPFWHQQTVLEAQRNAGGSQPLNLCRSAWAGSQRLGAAVWSGDIISRFFMLRNQVKAGLNMALSGIPWWTTDIGGFFGGHPEDAGFRELLVRWFQFAVFCPILRLHGERQPVVDGCGADNEVWSFGPEVFAILKELLFLRERIRPLLREAMRVCSETGLPPMRPLFLEYPGDPRCWEVEDQFFFGPDLMVAPVLEEGARARSVYLPAGCRWIHAGTGRTYEGAQRVEVPAPLAEIPVFVPEHARDLLELLQSPLQFQPDRLD